MRTLGLGICFTLALTGCTTSAEVAKSAREAAENAPLPPYLTTSGGGAAAVPAQVAMATDDTPPALIVIYTRWAAAAMDGRSAEALQAANQVGEKVPPEMARERPMVEYFMPTPYFALARFGRWEEVLVLQEPPDDLLFNLAMWHYARGVAFAATDQAADAKREYGALNALAAEIPPDRIVGDNQPAGLQLRLAKAALAGEIAARRGQCEAAIPKLEEAVDVQDSLPYMEPPPWYYPMRQALGAVLLQCGRADAAAVVFREDLRRNPNNGWSLYGLSQALRAQDDPAAAEADAQFRTAWRDADIQLTSARF